MQGLNVAGKPQPDREGESMKFLLKSVFWLVLLLLLIPTDKDQQNQIYGTAQAAMNDVAAFCTRNPQTCATGQDAFAVLVQKAKYGTDLVMGLVEGQSAPLGNSLAQDSLSPNNPPQNNVLPQAIDPPQTATLQGEPSGVMPVPGRCRWNPRLGTTPRPKTRSTLRTAMRPGTDRTPNFARARSELNSLAVSRLPTARVVWEGRTLSLPSSAPNPFDADPSQPPQLTSILVPWTR